jgi:hypothetical protein
VSRRGNVQFRKEPMELDLEGSLTEDEKVRVKVDVVSMGTFRNEHVGSVSFLLKQLIDKSHIQGPFRLDSGQGELELELRWVGYFDTPLQ